jgi:hypothetical protein
LTCAIFLAKIRRIFLRLNVIPTLIPTRRFLYIHCASSSRFPAVLSQTSFIHLHCNPPPRPIVGPPAGSYSVDVPVPEVFAVHVMKTHRGSRDIAPPIRNLGVRWGVWPTSRFFLFTRKESVLVLFE